MGPTAATNAASPVWVELHVDDELLSAEPGLYPAARALLRTLAALAEQRGARLSFRVREPLARLAADDGLLPGLVARGHEVGAHAHGRRLGRTVEAIRAAGVSPRVAVPGLVQAGPEGRAALLDQAAGLGIELVTDHGAERGWAYEGLLPRRERGVEVMAPTVRPFDWGLMSLDGTRHGVDAGAIDRLRRLERHAARLGARAFGVALHEHDLCPAGSLEPTPAALDALAGYLDERVVPSYTLSMPRRAGAESQPPAVGDAQVRLRRWTGGIRSRLRRRVLPGGRVLGRGALGGGERIELDVDGRRLVTQRHGPRRPKGCCVVSVSGERGGRRLGVLPLGLQADDLAVLGWAVWLYDRAGTGDSPAAVRAGADPGLTPGNPAHTTDWRTVLRRARGEGVPVVALSWSAGVLPVLRAAADGERPDGLVDAEGPVDRWSLIPPGPVPEAEALRARDPWDDAAWQGIEALTLIDRLGVPYARLQGERDHVHGRMTHHAGRVHAAASAAGLTTRPLRVVEGRLRDHPRELLDALQWTLRQIRGW